MNQQIVFFEWPSCAGKSTAVSALLWEYPNIFHINKDKVKWLISNYSSDNPLHIKILHKMLLSMTQIALDNWLSVFLEWQKLLATDILNYTNNSNIQVNYINIEAPFEVLKKRFDQRVIECEEKWIKISNKSVEWLKNRYNIYQSEKYSEWINIDTSILSEEEVVDKIKKYIWINS
jgi:deoxyadenosine/deoxycytidine kinase